MRNKSIIIGTFSKFLHGQMIGCIGPAGRSLTASALDYTEDERDNSLLNIFNPLSHYTAR
jgi:hypothetical protein